MQIIMLDPTKKRVSSSYKSYLVLKFLHQAKHSMKYLPIKNHTKILSKTPRTIKVPLI